ncbi:MAG: hypothetical protein K2W95_21205 [Candidatus Obscuribacterales bacterium]|nr:hypothetical protein [Candidatus Obscuribacterales bacterium]
MRTPVILTAIIAFLTLPVGAQNESFSASTQSAVPGLSPNASQLADQLGVTASLKTLISARNSQADWRHTPAIQATRQDLLEDLFTAELEVRTAQSKLDQEIALADDVRAKLEEGRDKAVTLTAAANLITSAFNGIAGNSLDFSEKLKLPSDILDVAEGGVSAVLAGMALYQQKGEKRLSDRISGVISHLFDTNSKNEDYPESVWRFLNTVPAASTTGLTRRVSLLNAWTKAGIIRRGQERWEHRLSHITKGTMDRHRITISVLEDRDAMLHDLRATISPMEELLLEIMNLVKTR